MGSSALSRRMIIRGVFIDAAIRTWYGTASMFWPVVVVPVSTMMKQVHQRTSGQQQIWQGAKQVGAMLRKEEICSNQCKSGKSQGPGHASIENATFLGVLVHETLLSNAVRAPICAVQTLDACAHQSFPMTGAIVQDTYARATTASGTKNSDYLPSRG